MSDVDGADSTGSRESGGRQNVNMYPNSGDLSNAEVNLLMQQRMNIYSLMHHMARRVSSKVPKTAVFATRIISAT